MNSQSLKQNVTYIAIAVIVFLILSAIKPANPFNPTGIILPMIKQPLIPTIKPVQLYQVMPLGASAIAYVNVEAHSLNPTPQQEQLVLKKAVQLAQQAGADGLVINTFGYEGANVLNPAPLSKYVLFTTAIKTL
jgi:hypothetical protein